MLSVMKQVDRGALQMASLHQHRLSAQAGQRAGGFFHLLEIRYRAAGHRFSLMQIGRHQRGERQQHREHGLAGVVVHQRRAMLRDHHRIHNNGTTQRPEFEGHHLDNAAFAQRTGLDCAGRNVLHHGADLGGHEVG